MHSYFQLQYGISTIYIVWGEGTVNMEKTYDNTVFTQLQDVPLTY